MRWFAETASVVAAGLLIVHSGCGHRTAAPKATVVERVTAAEPQRKTLALYTSQPGRVEAFEETPMYPKLTGYVQQVLADIGDPVRKDQVLVKLWIPEMADELKQKEALVGQAEADVQQAGAAIVAAQAASRTAQARVSQAQAGVLRAEGVYDRWKSEHERIMQLAASGSVTNKLADETLNQFQSAEAARQEVAASVESANAVLNESQANVQKAQADQRAAQAGLRVAQADLARTKTLLGYAEIKSPFDGVVTSRSIDTGHYVHPANDGANKPLMVVARTDKVRIFADVPEMEAPLVDSGDSATIQVQALGGKEFDAKVTRTSWSLATSNRSLRTEIDVLNPGGLLRPGMYATATILLEQKNDALVVPISAVVQKGGETYCCAVRSDKIEHLPITLGLRSGEEVEVLTGLDPHQTIVMARAGSLQAGQPVEVIKPGG